LTQPILPFAPENIYIVLVQPQHPGNIGATGRAMKNMGFSRLRVVDPASLDLKRAGWMAPGAQDVLERMEVFQTVEDALADITTVVGTTSRSRHWRFPILGARNLGPYLLPRARNNRVAILFGREDYGLTNDVAGLCELLITIPTEGHKSLNLAQAVLIVVYELMMSRHPEPLDQPRTLATQDERARLGDALLRLSHRVEFQKARNPAQVRAMLQGNTGRMELDCREIGNVLGLVRKINYHLSAAGLPDAPAPPALPPLPPHGDGHTPEIRLSSPSSGADAAGLPPPPSSTEFPDDG